MSVLFLVGHGRLCVFRSSRNVGRNWRVLSLIDVVSSLNRQLCGPRIMKKSEEVLNLLVHHPCMFESPNVGWAKCSAYVASLPGRAELTIGADAAADVLNNEKGSRVSADALNSEKGFRVAAEALNSEKDYRVSAEVLNDESDSGVAIGPLNNESNFDVAIEASNENNPGVAIEASSDEINTSIVAEVLDEKSIGQVAATSTAEKTGAK
ncbi:hypothetical protein EV181_004120 [Coemansia sp. RSA 532]|nr:hypothetical protein EV181_004120 [Coemansia sp. RSA 532]